MAENSKKRGGSFRKFFPNLFFNKSKNKNVLKVTNDAPTSNQYHDPRSMIRSDKYESDDNDKIYENLSENQQCSGDTQSISTSDNNSSSSTLVSESVKNRPQHYGTSDQLVDTYTARPQVPPRPHDMHSGKHKNQGYDNHSQYPDVYYHSLEKLSDKISPIDEMEIYKASQVQANPASVGAEIKRVSTKFIISPKKEAEVRTIQPIRARSLSFNQNEGNKLYSRPQIKRNTNVEKAYNYSAPTSPLPINHKIPNMPKTASPYEHVRKHMIETEEKRNNSMSRINLGQPSSPVPRTYTNRAISLPASKESTLEREITRKKIEAYYWQRLKDLKESEDAYYMRQTALQSTVGSNQPNGNRTRNSLESRSCSLPRGTNQIREPIYEPMYTPRFIKNAPERRTDTFIKKRTEPIEPEVIYRNPVKKPSNIQSLPMPKIPSIQRGSLNRSKGSASLPKRVSFEEQIPKSKSAVSPKVTYGFKTENNSKDSSTNTEVGEPLSLPPRPPVRTTSVSNKSVKVVNNKEIIRSAGAGGHSGYSESESGSEAGEIQRILLSNAQKALQQYLL